MFDIFRVNNDRSIVEQLFSLVLNKMPSEYDHYLRQIQEGVIRRLLSGGGGMPNYIAVIYNTKISSLYERKHEKGFSISGVTVFDKKSGKNVVLEFYFHSGLVAGINADINIKKCSFDMDTLNVDSSRVKYEKSSTEIENYLTELGVLKFNASEVHEVLVGKDLMIYLRDLEDGDFLAVNQHGFYIVSIGSREAFKVSSVYFDEIKKEYLHLSSERIYSYLPD
ncbi:hypothetical protein [Pectobacterium zantedeschiae]|uniref:hypothetical protein n=1 Tax=Pectobacterium zantedeschiae TaxID=2034769 RepID=UPI00101CEF75|nr:hypothetical protein [Pectobacterium zantedeschiae]RYC40458.1 hypothetical protein DEH81_16200 [Pectobacterium zantedeschiae]